MKKTLTLSITFVGLSLLLAPTPSHAQQVASFGARDDAPRLEAGRAARPSAEEQRARVASLEKRKAALEKYLASVNPASADYEATERSIRALDVKLRDIVAAGEAEAARAIPVRVSPQMAGAAAEDAPSSNLLSISPGERRSKFKSEVRIKVSPSFNSNIKISVVNNTGEEVYSNTLRYLVRGVDDYTTTVTLGDGVNIVRASSTDDKVSSNALVISGGELPVAEPSARAAAAPKAFRRQGGGGLVGLLLGGVVVSQQAENFSQADPFLGFIVGYDDTADDDWRLRWRVQGIFQVQAKKEEAPAESAAGEEDEEGEDTTNSTDFKSFLASRKSFDIEMSLWSDAAIKPLIFWGGNGDPNVRVGFYGSVGGSVYIDKNELRGDESVKVEDPDGESADENGQTELDPERAKIDNDIDHFYELGLIGNFFGGDVADRKLFMQARIGYGRYEGMAGFNPGKTGFLNDSRNRFVGKLRVFPTFLDRSPSGTADSSPMFGVEISAGRGPDQIKFFTGVATAIKLFK
jgi:hypothetical protein